jgi:hypothetical protein
MNRFLLMGLMTGSLFLIGLSSGCGTPGYTPAERDARIGRNWSYEGGQAIDDVDHILLLRPSSTMTYWNVQQNPDPN